MFGGKKYFLYFKDWGFQKGDLTSYKKTDANYRLLDVVVAGAGGLVLVGADVILFDVSAEGEVGGEEAEEEDAEAGGEEGGAEEGLVLLGQLLDEVADGRGEAVPLLLGLLVAGLGELPKERGIGPEDWKQGGRGQFSKRS